MLQIRREPIYVLQKENLKTSLELKPETKLKKC